ncbi:MAG: EAL domain-containing protein [Fibrobacteria bacterium]|nr:EAL domain-containing protein [Fibrobacteria bacterium]
MELDTTTLHARLLENSSEFWFALDRSIRVVATGPTVERRLGWIEADLVGRDLSTLVHPEDWEGIRLQLSHVIPYPNSMIRLEFRLLHARGTWSNLDATFCNLLGVPGMDSLVIQAQDITRFKLAEEALRFAEEKYRGIFENAVEGIFQSSPEGRFLSANPALARLYGYESPSHLIHSVRDIAHDIYVEESGRPRFLEQMDAEGAVQGYEARVRRRDGTVIWISENARAVRGSDDAILYFEGTVEDITARREAEDALRTSQERYALAAQGSNGGLWEWDLVLDRVYYSPRWATLVGASESELSDRPDEWWDRVHPRDIDLLRQEIQSHLKGQTPHFECEYRILHKDGTWRWVLSRGMVLRSPEGRPLRMAGSVEEVTARKRVEEQLMQGALYDGLTGFPNRALLLDRARRALVRSRKSDDIHYVGVILLDIDRFKLVNDSLGHEAGDELVVAVGQAIEECLNARDTVARLGGDEFAILMEGYSDLSVFTRMTESVLTRVALPVRLRGQELYVTMSAGIAISERSQDQPEDLLRDAEAAMYKAKGQGKGRHVVYNPGMHEYAVAHLEMESALRRGVEREEFRVYYQPILDLEDGSLAGFEALVRWAHPEKGIVSPVVFIPLAEETGLIVEIGRQVLRESCRQLAHWRSLQGGLDDIWISVNISVKQFALHDIVDQVRSILQETGLPGECLKLEITESVIMDNSADASQKVLGLKELGIRLSIDDFGTGYSSLSYLHQFPFDTLKIDRSFVMRLGDAPERAAIVRTIIQLAQNLDMETVAEGVETRFQLGGLRSMGCRFGQGFLFGKPMPAVEAFHWFGKSFPIPGNVIL